MQESWFVEIIQSQQDLIKLMIRIKETASNHSPEYILFFRELNLMEKYVVQSWDQV